MSRMSECHCSECPEKHPRQAFISHAGEDAKIAKAAAKACCRAQISPYLFEYSTEFSQHEIDNARTIAAKINDSDMFLVVLSPSVSKAYWTQAWIGFEIGVSVGAAITSNGLDKMNYLSRKIIVLQDIYQEIKVSVPRIDVLFPFDFSRNWADPQELLELMSSYMSEPSTQMYQIGNKLRQRMMTGKIRCENGICKSVYDVVMPIKDVGRLGFRIWWKGIRFKRIRWIEENCRAKYTLKCPSCGQKVNCELTRSL